MFGAVVARSRRIKPRQALNVARVAVAPARKLLQQGIQPSFTGSDANSIGDE